MVRFYKISLRNFNLKENFQYIFKDLPDGGSKHIAETVKEIKKR